MTRKEKGRDQATQDKNTTQDYTNNPPRHTCFVCSEPTSLLHMFVDELPINVCVPLCTKHAMAIYEKGGRNFLKRLVADVKKEMHHD